MFRRRWPRWAIWTVLIVLLVVPRVAFLRADAYFDLCWGSGVWSDEGFYTYNARNAVLFGKEVLDDFNNRNIAPILDLIQFGVFKVFGVGLVSARAISVVFGLLALAFFYDGLRRVFGRRVGLTGLLLLGGEYSYLFYNRLALMESPAVCIACLAFWCWAVGGTVGVFGCGAVAMSLIAWKNNFLVLLPAPFLVLLWRRAPLKHFFAYALGVGITLVVYLVLWGIPHRDEIVHMNDFYRREQIQPKNLNQALWMARRGWIGYRAGMMQRLLTRTPVLSVLALIGLTIFPIKRHTRNLRAGKRTDMVRLLWLWLIIGLGLLSVIRYAPTRYYLVFYVPMAGIAAITLWRLPALLRLVPRSLIARCVAFVVFLGPFYHLGQPIYWLTELKWVLVQVSLGVGSLLSAATVAALSRARRLRARVTIHVVLASFLVISYGQVLWYFTHLEYRTSNFAHRIAQLTEPGSVILGDWAPNVCLDSDRRAIPVLKGLANDLRPVSRFHADYILVGDMRYQQVYWRRTAPDVVKNENFVRTFILYDYQMGLYRVPKNKPMKSRSGVH